MAWKSTAPTATSSTLFSSPRRITEQINTAGMSKIDTASCRKFSKESRLSGLPTELACGFPPTVYSTTWDRRITESNSRSLPVSLTGLGWRICHVMDGLAFGFHELGEPMALPEFRKLFHGPLMGNCGYTQKTAEETIAQGNADLISFARPFISNPDLVQRFKNGWPLADPAETSDWYSPIGEKGYTDFPTYAK